MIYSKYNYACLFEEVQAVEIASKLELHYPLTVVDQTECSLGDIETRATICNSKSHPSIVQDYHDVLDIAYYEH